MEEKSASDLQESTNDANDSEANDEEVI